jgi:hypothetical protein
MVRTSYPPVLKTFNRGSIQVFIMFCFPAMFVTAFVGMETWKKGKVQRLRHNDSR